MNIAVIRGSLSRDPEMRALPSGDRVVNYEVTVRDLSPAESVPVVWVEPTKGWDAMVAGDEVVVTGRVRRRFFRTGLGHGQPHRGGRGPRGPRPAGQAGAGPARPSLGHDRRGVGVSGHLPVLRGGAPTLGALVRDDPRGMA